MFPSDIIFARSSTAAKKGRTWTYSVREDMFRKLLTFQSVQMLKISITHQSRRPLSNWSRLMLESLEVLNFGFTEDPLHLSWEMLFSNKTGRFIACSRTWNLHWRPPPEETETCDSPSRNFNSFPLLYASYSHDPRETVKRLAFVKTI